MKIFQTKTILKALKQVFSRPVYVFLAVVVALLIFSLLILLPTGRFQLSAYYYQVTSIDKLSLSTFAVFAVLAGVMTSMEVYLVKKIKSNKLKSGGRGLLSMMAAIFAGMFSSSICAFCVVSLLTFLGAPVAILAPLLSFRWVIFAVSSLFLLVSLFFISRSITKKFK